MLERIGLVIGEEGELEAFNLKEHFRNIDSFIISHFDFHEIKT